MKHPFLINKISYLSKINPIIRLMIFSDTMEIMSRIGFIAPVFAVYIINRIPGGNLEVVGIATTIFMATKSFLQIPVSAVIDKIKGEKDDFWAMFIGSIWFAITPLLFIFVSSIWQLYLVQFSLGVASALVYPSWMAVFTRHMDKEHEGMEWGIYFTLIDLASALAATLGGIISYRFGFNYLFVLASAVSFVGAGFLFSVKNNLEKLKNIKIDS